MTLRRFKCPKCCGKGTIDVKPSDYSEWTSIACPACNGNRTIDVDDADEIPIAPNPKGPKP